MIKLLSLLLSVTLLNGQNFVYLLPDDIASYEAWIQSHIKKSNQPIHILTASMNYPALHKSFIAHQSHGLDLTLIVESLQNDPLRLIQYQHTHLYRYTSRPLGGSLIILDSYVCQIGAPLDQEILLRSASSIWCSDDPETMIQTKRLFALMQKRSHRYLK